MSRKNATEKLEEVRVIVANDNLCALVVEHFINAGINAFGDFREEDEEIMVRDAFSDRVDYVVFANVWHIIDIPNLRRRSNMDLIVKVYVRNEGTVKTMAIAAAIKMVLERRHL